MTEAKTAEIADYKTDRRSMANLIMERLDAARDGLRAQFIASEPDIGYFYIDEVLPVEVASAIHASFPAPETMTLRNSLRERKLIAAQMNRYNPILEEAIYAFQDARVVTALRSICGMASAYPDENLYAGGISMMTEGHFLNPHIDNSHDMDRDRWRVLNLLYYVSPDWKLANGGNLELWPHGLDSPAITVESKFNRLVVMATHGRSLHSVSPIRVDRARCCVSNYYFSDEPLRDDDEFHVTSFRGRPEQPVRDTILRADAAARGMVRKLFPKGVRENPHVYKRDDTK